MKKKKRLEEAAIIDNRFYNLIKSEFNFGVELECYIYLKLDENYNAVYSYSNNYVMSMNEFYDKKLKKLALEKYLNDAMYYFYGIEDDLIQKVISDSSLADYDNGFEIVTRKMNFYEFSSVYPKFLNLLKEEFDVGYDGTTAIHVSFSSDYLSDLIENKIEKLNWFKVAILSDVENILDKSNRRMNQYASSIKLWLRDFFENIKHYIYTVDYESNIEKGHWIVMLRDYLERIRDDIASEKDIKNFFRILSKLFGLYLFKDKYNVFNIKNYYSQDGRIEVRAFNSKMIDKWGQVVRDIIVICSAVLLAASNLYEKEYREAALKIIRDELIDIENEKLYRSIEDYYQSIENDYYEKW